MTRQVEVKVAQLCPALRPHGPYRLAFPSPWNLLNPGIEPRFPALQADSFYQLSCEGSPTKDREEAKENHFSLFPCLSLLTVVTESHCILW